MLIHSSQPRNEVESVNLLVPSTHKNKLNELQQKKEEVKSCAWHCWDGYIYHIGT